MSESQKNNVAASHSFERVDYSKTVPSGARPRPAAGIKSNSHVHPAVLKIKSVRAALRAEANHCARFSLQPAKIGILVGINTCGQILLAKPVGVSWATWLSWILLQRAALCRRCPSMRRGNRECGEMIAAKTDRQQRDRAPPHRRFDERIEFRRPGG